MSRSPRRVASQVGAALLVVAASIWALAAPGTPEADCADLESALITAAGTLDTDDDAPSALYVEAGGCVSGDDWRRDEDADAYPAAAGPSCCVSCAGLDPSDCATAAMGHFWLPADDAAPDCDDDDPDVHDGADEVVADGIDQDCDGAEVCYVDADGDGIGGATTGVAPVGDLGCDAHDGFASTSGDACDDAAALQAPIHWYADCDGDGAFDPVPAEACTAEAAVDLFADARPTCAGLAAGQVTTSPGTFDCDDDEDAYDTEQEWYADCDGDGHHGAQAWLACTPSAAVSQVIAAGGVCAGIDTGDVTSMDPGTSADCDDAAASTHVGAVEVVGDGVDQDCDASDLCYLDDDRDGVGGLGTGETPAGSLDCDAHDGLASISGDACDEVPTLLDEVDWYADCDGDGFPGDAVRSACTAAEAFPGCASVTQGSDPWTEGLDCDDDDGETGGAPSWVADCDRDGAVGEYVHQACSAAAAREAFAERAPTDGYCKHPQVQVYDLDAPDLPPFECNDDAKHDVTPRSVWWADCDGDGAYGVGVNPDEIEETLEVEACTAVDAHVRFVARRSDCATAGAFDVTDVEPLTGYDCDDTSPATGTPVAYYADCDRDGLVGTDAQDACTADEAAVRFEGARATCVGLDPADLTTSPGAFDCDDDDDASTAPLLWYADCDLDGHHGATTWTACTADDAVIAILASGDLHCLTIGVGDVTTTDPGTSADCDDAERTTHPGAEELVGDGVDQDCDTSDLCYVDADGDGAGGTDTAVAPPGSLDCDAEDGLASTSTDACDDLPELRDEVPWYADCDGDGFPGDAVRSACTGAEAFPDCAMVTQGAEPWVAGLDCADGDADTRGSPFWVADCDGDGLVGEAVQEACTGAAAADAFPDRAPTSAYCTRGLLNVYNTDKPNLPDYECDDTSKQDKTLRTTWWADCDGDNAYGAGSDPGLIFEIEACSAVDARERFDALRLDCDAAEHFNVTDLEPVSGYDCDDTSDAIGTSIAYYADCDGDGVFGPVPEHACTAAEAAERFDAGRATCVGIQGHNLTTTPGPVDCDDDDGDFFIEQDWFADCDGDDSYAAQAWRACTPSDAVDVVRAGGGAACDAVDVDRVTTSRPGASADCDDADPIEFPGQTWFADCDGDGAFGSDREEPACSAELAQDAFSRWCGAILHTTPLQPVTFGGGFTALPTDVTPDAPGDAADCWDGDAAWRDGAVWRADCDFDGKFGAETHTSCSALDARAVLCPSVPDDACSPPTGWPATFTDMTTSDPTEVDCSDRECLVRPGSTVTTPGRDWNCDGTVACFVDGDGDGSGAGNPESLTGAPPGGTCAAFSGFASSGGDCDDEDDTVYEGAPERVADAVDQDCDGYDLCWLDEDRDGFGRDADGDGYDDGNEAYDVSHLAPPAGATCEAIARDYDVPASSLSTDCDDQNADYFPGQLWHPDCDGDAFPRDTQFAACSESEALQVPACPGNALPVHAWFVTHATRPAFDCLDEDPIRYPGSSETCVGDKTGPCEVCEVHDQLDDDCNGDVNTAGPLGTIPSDNPPGANLLLEAYVDIDKDGFGSDSAPTQFVCEVLPGLSANNLDCDDRDPGTRPGAFEICDLKDQNCNGTVDEAEGINVDDPEGASCIVLYRDRDLDGTGDPTQARCVCPERRAPPAPYTPLDDDDTGLFDPVQPPDPLRGSYAGDAYVAPPTDCDDGHADIRPHECIDGIDNDGDGFIDGDDAGCAVGAADGRRSASESNRARTQLLHPDRVLVVRERIDGHDNECDGYVPIVELDCDDDGSFPRLAPDTPEAFEKAAEAGLTACDPAATPPALDCWGEPLALECDAISGLWRIRYGASEDGFGGRFTGGFRNLVSPFGCDRAGDCDDHCPTRCPAAPEACDGVDNDCTLVDPSAGYEGPIPGVPAALDASLSLEGTVVAAELDFDGDGHASCTEDFLDQDSEVHAAPRACEPYPDEILRTDCDDLCFAINPSSTEVCNGFVDVCGARASEREGFDSDGDGHADCGAYGPEGAITDEEAYVPVWFDCADPDVLPSTLLRACGAAAAPVDATATPGLLVPLIPPRARAPACDAELATALGALARRAGRADADTWIASSSAPDLVRQLCAPGAPTGGTCSVVRIAILEDSELAQAAEDGGDARITAACLAAPEQRTVRTVWSRPRITDARKGVVELECLRLFGTPCDRVTASTPRAGLGAPPDVDVLLEPGGEGDTGAIGPDDAPFWLELGRFGPSTAPGATMTCWGDPRTEAVGTRTGGDCDDGSGQAHRDLPEGPHDIVLAFEGQNGDCARCVDGIDNNCDGLTDCEDPTCAVCFVGQGQGCAGARDACAVPKADDEKGCSTTPARGLAVLLSLPLVALFGRRRPGRLR